MDKGNPGSMTFLSHGTPNKRISTAKACIKSNSATISPPGASIVVAVCVMVDVNVPTRSFSSKPKVLNINIVPSGKYDQDKMG